MQRALEGFAEREKLRKESDRKYMAQRRPLDPSEDEALKLGVITKNDEMLVPSAYAGGYFVDGKARDRREWVPTKKIARETMLMMRHRYPAAKAEELREMTKRKLREQGEYTANRGFSVRWPTEKELNAWLSE